MSLAAIDRTFYWPSLLLIFRVQITIFHRLRACLGTRCGGADMTAIGPRIAAQQTAIMGPLAVMPTPGRPSPARARPQVKAAAQAAALATAGSSASLRSTSTGSHVSAAARRASRPTTLWIKLNFTVKAARLQSLKKQKYQHLQEEALLRARGLLQNWEDGPVLLTEDLYRRAAGERDAQELMNYTPEALALRFGLRNDPAVLEAVRAIWQIEMPRDALGCIDQRAYTALFRRIGVCLEAESADGAARRPKRARRLEKTIEQDWQRDSRGEAAMSFANFFDAVFELADMWCDTIDVEEYVEFLETLLRRVSTKRPKGKPRVMCPMKQVKGIDDDSSESESESESEEEDDEDEEEEEEEEEVKKPVINAPFLMAKSLQVSKPLTPTIARSVLSKAAALAALRPSQPVLRQPPPVQGAVVPPQGVRQERRPSILNTVRFGENGLESIASPSASSSAMKSQAGGFQSLLATHKDSLSVVREGNEALSSISNDYRHLLHGSTASPAGDTASSGLHSVTDMADISRMLNPRPSEPNANAKAIATGRPLSGSSRHASSTTLHPPSLQHSTQPKGATPVLRSRAATNESHASGGKNRVTMILPGENSGAVGHAKKTATPTSLVLPERQARDRSAQTAVTNKLSRTAAGFHRQSNAVANNGIRFDGEAASITSGGSESSLSVLGPRRRDDVSSTASIREVVTDSSSANIHSRLAVNQRHSDEAGQDELVVAAYASVNGNHTRESSTQANGQQHHSGNIWSKESDMQEHYSEKQLNNARADHSPGNQVYISGVEPPTMSRARAAPPTTSTKAANHMASTNEAQQLHYDTTERTTEHYTIKSWNVSPSPATMHLSSPNRPEVHQTPVMEYVSGSPTILPSADSPAHPPKSNALPDPQHPNADKANLDSTSRPPDFTGSYTMTSYHFPGRSEAKPTKHRGINPQDRSSASPGSASPYIHDQEPTPLWFSIGREQLTGSQHKSTPTLPRPRGANRKSKKRVEPQTPTKGDELSLSPWETSGSDSEDEFRQAHDDSFFRSNGDGPEILSSSHRKRGNVSTPDRRKHIPIEYLASRVVSAPPLTISPIGGPVQRPRHYTASSHSLQNSASAPMLPSTHNEFDSDTYQDSPPLSPSLLVTAIHKRGGSPVYMMPNSQAMLSPLGAHHQPKPQCHDRFPTDGFVLSDASIEGLQLHHARLDQELGRRRLEPIDGRDGATNEDRSHPYNTPYRADPTFSTCEFECGRLHTAPLASAYRLDKLSRGENYSHDPGAKPQREQDDMIVNEDALLVVNDREKPVVIDASEWEREVLEKAARKSPSRSDMMRRRFKYTHGR